MILTWWVISLRLVLFRATPVSYHRHLAHQSDRSLPLLFKIAPVSCLASVWSTSCFEPGSTWGQEVREFPSSFTVESTWNPGCVRKSREGVVDRRWQMWFLLTPQVRAGSRRRQDLLDLTPRGREEESHQSRQARWTPENPAGKGPESGSEFSFCWRQPKTINMHTRDRGLAESSSQRQTAWQTCSAGHTQSEQRMLFKRFCLSLPFWITLPC